MSLANDQRESGLRLELSNSAMRVLVGDKYVAAADNTEPEAFEMMDSGYLAREPIAFECLKGADNSTETVDIDGVITPMDLRGCRPQIRGKVQIETSVTREIVRIQDCGSAWLIYTIRRSAAQ